MRVQIGHEPKWPLVPYDRIAIHSVKTRLWASTYKYIRFYLHRLNRSVSFIHVIYKVSILKTKAKKHPTVLIWSKPRSPACGARGLDNAAPCEAFRWSSQHGHPQKNVKKWLPTGVQPFKKDFEFQIPRGLTQNPFPPCLSCHSEPWQQLNLTPKFFSGLILGWPCWSKNNHCIVTARPKRGLE